MGFCFGLCLCVVYGIIFGSMYVCMSVISLMIIVNSRLCCIVKWNSLDFLLMRFVVVYVIVIDCGEIIFVVMLFVVFVVIVSVFGMLS